MNMLCLPTLIAIAFTVLYPCVVLGGSNLPENLLVPPFPPTFELSRSTIIQACNVVPTNLSYVAQYGIVSYDWSNLAAVWHNDHPQDSDVKLAEEAARAKKVAPQTLIWIYRNMVQAYASFSQVREKLEDPAYSGWFVPFGPNANHSKLPICEINSVGKKVCSNYYHYAGQRPGGDCGNVPCGWYTFDHRNASLRFWLINEYLLAAPLGLGDASVVSGFYFDDWWTYQGPTENGPFSAGSGYAADSIAIMDIYAGWATTMIAAEKAINAAGGFSWSGINCMLDNKPQQMPCGLTKTEGYPRANLSYDAPVRGETLDESKAVCTAWLRAACVPGSILGEIPLLLGFTRNNNGAQFPLPAVNEDIATFLLVRGKYAWLGFGWIGCTTDYQYPDLLRRDFGVPVEPNCHEVSPGVFTRQWTKALVQMDCNSYTGRFDPPL